MCRCPQSELVVHAENNSPFLAVSRLTRHIEVSHWGYISVEETLDVRHVGATLRGSFSRFDYQREHNSGVSSVQQFKVRPVGGGGEKGEVVAEEQGKDTNGVGLHRTFTGPPRLHQCSKNCPFVWELTTSGG